MLIIFLSVPIIIFFVVFIRFRPRLKVISRAEPTNALVDAVKGYFNGGSKTSDNPMINLMKSSGLMPGGPPGAQANNAQPQGYSDQPYSDTQTPSDPFVIALQSVAGKYSALSMLGFDTVVFEIEIRNEDRKLFYRFSTSNSQVTPISPVGEKEVQLRMSAYNTEDLIEFIRSGETSSTSKVDVKNSLF